MPPQVLKKKRTGKSFNQKSIEVYNNIVNMKVNYRGANFRAFQISEFGTLPVWNHSRSRELYVTIALIPRPCNKC